MKNLDIRRNFNVKGRLILIGVMLAFATEGCSNGGPVAKTNAVENAEMTNLEVIAAAPSRTPKQSARH